ncbi:winged helix-turn-helix transcriptional regulator [Halorubrum vacuolatum]|uniref:Transcriptional regulator, HxlR family n=1 Tax=Halorubrum vacuolatum TaxID=63740 RepID=A0A238VJV9_HALVU|nr:winged helix-turn-helix transcriptional regulator [Halorubrum vacuolatum]SNR34655.1 transcriptional regulator, HxlR family [Halorubrum vacuolatum]
MSRDGPDASSDRRPALDALSLLAGKWRPTVLILLIREGPLGFNDILGRIPDVSGKVLSETLDTLVDAGLIRRRVTSESPLRVQYTATEAGQGMAPVFDALDDWGRRHLEPDDPVVLLADGDRRITEMYGGWMSDRYTVIRVHDADEFADHRGTEPTVVVFDERFPGLSLPRMRRVVGSTPRTIALIGDRPTVDLLDLDCDDVLRKPVVRSTLLEAVDRQLARRDEPSERREHAAIAARISLLEAVHPPGRLEASDAYLDACERLDELESLLADD